MMMGFGFLTMLVLLAIPILLIVVAVVWMMKQATQPGQVRPAAPNPPVAARPTVVPPAPAPNAGRVCSHCGADLQSEWTHCPQCGAPVG